MTDSVQAIQESYTRIKLLNNDIQIKDQTINLLQERLAEMEEQMNQAIKQKDYVDRQFSILQDEHDQMFENQQRKTKQLQQFNQQLLVALKEVQDKNQELLEQVQYYSQEIQSKEQALQELTEQIALIKDAVKGLEEELSQLTKKNQQLKKEKQDAEQQMRQIVAEKNKFESSVTNMLKQLETENDLLKQELEDYRTRLEQQHQELVELKYVKIQFEDLEKKHSQLNEQFNIQIQTAMECEKNYALQFDEMNKANEKLRKQCEVFNEQYEQQKDYNSTIENQNKEFQKLFGYMQNQIDEIMSECLQINKSYIPQDPILESKKSSTSNKHSSSKKKKKNSYNISQIEDFFVDIKDILMDLIETNAHLKEEKDQVSENILDMHKVGEQLKLKFDQLNQEYTKTKEKLQQEHKSIQEQQNDKINQLEDALQQQNLKAQQDNQYINSLIDKCYHQDQQFLAFEQQIQQSKWQTQNIVQEFEELRNEHNQLKSEFSDLQVRKAISQNKVALSYSVISHLLSVEKSQKTFSQFIQYSNYLHYFVLMRNEFKNNSNLIYKRFRRAVYAVIFVKKIRQSILPSNEKSQLNFDKNEELDIVLEKYIPIFHSLEEGSGVEYNAFDKMIKDMKIQVNKYSYRSQIRSTNSQQYYQLINLAKEDISKKNSGNQQIDYYKKQLSIFQNKITQLDQYVQQLEQELQEKSSQIKKQSNLQQSEEKQVSKYRIEPSSPITNNLSAVLQNELTQILSKKSTITNKAGQIVKQGF
ncbi:unnamed protein product (macronuclear) [Paramecium tetraurelia]|uniref:Uncharacterized protein n=1 Tax=Paramecium tetraurelia TaxID=5888 RepID=A0DZL3_PARTE|nr:uncharacterized protein GSPATT00021648001 [Paramecium tetraurelia]CAK88480.1 unnamed protein product [Paramecium tetraurelia]|eukprot:XP_001455877.1 hypothetical protein (macronuclear) [Paramecium tetraurelia strain d4-2]